jgi:phage head maturation protease
MSQRCGLWVTLRNRSDSHGLIARLESAPLTQG